MQFSLKNLILKHMLSFRSERYRRLQ